MTYLYLRYADREGKARAPAGRQRGHRLRRYLAKERWCFLRAWPSPIWLVARESVQARRSRRRSNRCWVFRVLLLAWRRTRRYRVFTEYTAEPRSWSRPHPQRRRRWPRGHHVLELFRRYLHIDKGWVVAFYVFLPCWLGLLGFVRNPRMRGMLSVVQSYLSSCSLLVRSVNPLSALAALHEPLLGPTAPFVELCTALLFALVGPNSGPSAARGESRGSSSASSGTAQACCSSSAWRWAQRATALKQEGHRALTTGDELTEMRTTPTRGICRS